MFCPECGTLSFPMPSGVINCTNYKCGYEGPANVKVKGVDGREVDLSMTRSSTKAESRIFEVIKDSDELKGPLTVGHYHCPKCDSFKVYSYLEPLLDMAEVQVAMLTCKECGFGWREH